MIMATSDSAPEEVVSIIPLMMSLIPQNWKILNDIKEVGGHICMNASWHDTLKMQRVVAWFAMDMPVSGGPERFCGLPGMILEMDVNDGAMVITADKVEKQSLTTEMDLPKKMKGKRIHEHDYTRIMEKYASALLSKTVKIQYK